MKYHVFKRIIIIFLGCIFLFGCSSTVGKEEKIIKKLKDINSYTCNVTVKAKNNKSVMEYELKHYYKKNTGFRVEVIKPKELKGQILIYTANKFLSYNPASDNTLSVDDSNEIFGYHMLLGTFLQYYNEYNIEETKSESYKDFKCYTYRLTLANSNTYMNQVKCYVNKENGLPVKMDILDKDGNKTTEVEYTDFVWNPKIDTEIFELNKNIEGKKEILK